jgi:hypothetical protein
MTKRDLKADKFADVILITGGLACALTFVYLVYSYPLTGRKHFNSLVGVSLYLGFPVMVAALSFAALWLRSSYKINLALSILSISVAVYAAEFLLGVSMSTRSGAEVTLWGMGRFSAEQKEEISALAKRAGRDFDFRTRAGVVRELRQQGISAVPSFIPLELLKRQADGTFRSELHAGGAEILPVSGISNSVTVLCNETGRYAMYDSDEHGFHNPKGLWASGQVAIAALGDSFTAGACVPSNKHFVALIRNHYPATLNLGMLGQGPLIQLAALKEYLPFVKPQVVLWAFFEGNDLGDLQTESKSPLLRNYLKENFTQSLFHRQPEIDQILTAYVEQALKTELAKQNERKETLARQNERKGTLASLKMLAEIIKLSHVRHMLRVVYWRPVQPSPNGEDGTDRTAPVDLYRAILVEAKASVRSWGGTLYFIYLPSRDMYVNKKDDQRESMLAMVRDLNIPVIDIDASFQKQRDPLSLFPFRRFGHYNEEGNRVVAEAVLSSVAAKKSQ